MLSVSYENLGIVVLSYNHPQITCACVDSVLKHFKPESLVLVHNGSSPSNVEILKEKYPNLRHLVFDQNQHFTGGANGGLKECFKNHSWCLFLTNDTQIKKIQMPITLDSPGIFAPFVFKRQTDKIDSIGGRANLNRAQLVHLKSPDLKMIDQSFYVPGAAFLIDKLSFETLGGFDESLQTYWEDVELSLRAKTQNIRLGFCQELQISHGIGKTCHHLTEYTIYYFHRNKIRVSLKYARCKSILWFNLLRQYVLFQFRLWRQGRKNDMMLYHQAYKDGIFGMKSKTT